MDVVEVVPGIDVALLPSLPCSLDPPSLASLGTPQLEASAEIKSTTLDAALFSIGALGMQVRPRTAGMHVLLATCNEA